MTIKRITGTFEELRDFNIRSVLTAYVKPPSNVHPTQPGFTQKTLTFEPVWYEYHHKNIHHTLRGYLITVSLPEKLEGRVAHKVAADAVDCCFLLETAKMQTMLVPLSVGDTILKRLAAKPEITQQAQWHTKISPSKDGLSR